MSVQAARVGSVGGANERQWNPLSAVNRMLEFCYE